MIDDHEKAGLSFLYQCVVRICFPRIIATFRSATVTLRTNFVILPSRTIMPMVGVHLHIHKQLAYKTPSPCPVFPSLLLLMIAPSRGAHPWSS